MDNSDVRSAALQFAELGIPVVPLHTPTPGGCSCRNPKCNSPGKHPRHHGRDLPNGLSDASSDLKVVAKWWDRWPDANIGVITGAKSGLVVVDADGEEGVNSVLANTPPEAVDKSIIVQTGNGGYHLYFRCPKDREVSNRVRLLPGVDIRGNGGYVVAPPSIHSSGKTYTWVTTEFPESLATLPDVFQPAKNGRDNKERLTRDKWEERLEQGRRNVEITRRAGKLIANDIPPSVVYTTLCLLNDEICDPPLDEEDIEKIVDSVSRRDEDQRKSRDYKRRDAEQQSAATAFNTLTFAEALQKHGAYELTWAIPEWFPDQTVGLVVAPPGSFKTWILADLFTAIGSGRKFLGHFESRSTGPVLMIQQEDFMPMLMNRVCQILGAGEPKYSDKYGYTLPVFDNTLPLYFHDERQLHIDDQNSIDGLRRKIEEIRPSLVVLDPLYSAVDIKDYMSEAAQRLLMLKSLRDEYKCSFMLAHHTTKSKGDGRQRDDAWGSQFLNAWLETGWQLRSEDEEEPSMITIERHFKVAVNPPLVNIKFVIDEYNYSTEVHEISKDDAESGTSKEQEILDMVSTGKIQSKMVIRKTMKLSGLGVIDKVFKKHGITMVNGTYCRPTPEIEMEEE